MSCGVKPAVIFVGEIQSYLEAQNQPYENIQVDGNDALRDVLETQYGIRYIPVVEMGGDNKYEALLNPDLEELTKALESYNQAV